MGVTITAYARHRGVSRQAVYDAIRAGRITRLPDGTIDLRLADQQWEENTAIPDGRTLSEASAGRPVTYADARAESERERARILRMRADEREGNLVPREDVERHWFQAARTLRDRLLGIPDAVAPDLAATDDEYTIRRRLTEELHQALHATADAVEADVARGMEPAPGAEPAPRTVLGGKRRK